MVSLVGIASANRARVTDDGPCAAGERSFLIDETAAALGVSRRTVYYRIRDGRLRTIRTRGGSQRVLLSSIEALRSEATRARDAASDACAHPADGVSAVEARDFVVRT